MILWEIHQSIRDIEQSFRSAEAAVSYFEKACLDNPTLAQSSGLRLRDIRNCAKHLEETYLVPIFAEFEITLRDYWHSGLSRQSHPKAETLLDRVASARAISSDVLKNAHAVRAYRNSLIHGGAAPLKTTLAEARQFLLKFLSHLPNKW